MHWPIVPILVPAIIAAITVLRVARNTELGRHLSLGSMVAMLATAFVLFAMASGDAITIYRLGDWPAPFGIVLVLDRLSALMLLITNVLGLVVLAHAMLVGLDRRGLHFHPLFQFQMLGLNGAFLTGDLFNLFVFFEILLIASYGLLLHGQGAARLQAGTQYVIVNLVGSTIFLIAVGLLYGLTGTLNMADLAVRIAAAPAGDQALIRMAAQVLIAVFALKAALLPLQLWLPRAYANTSAPVAALFAILTKVGVYAIVRCTILMFGEGAGAAAFAPAGWMLPAALLGVGAGFAGMLAAGRLRALAAFGIIASTSTLLVGVGLFSARGIAAALFYLPHSVFAGALMFLIADLVARARGRAADLLHPGGRPPGFGALAMLFFLAAIALSGLPPLPGFIGKLLILDAARGSDLAGWIWGVVLGFTLIGVIALSRAGTALFWKPVKAGAGPDAHRPPAAPEPAPPHVPALRPVALAPAGALIALLVLLGAWAGPATRFADLAAAQIFAREGYVAAVLGPGAAGSRSPDQAGGLP